VGAETKKVMPLHEHIYQKYNKTFTYLEINYTSTRHLDSALNLCNREVIQEYEDEVELWKTYGGA